MTQAIFARSSVCCASSNRSAASRNKRIRSRALYVCERARISSTSLCSKFRSSLVAVIGGLPCCEGERAQTRTRGHRHPRSPPAPPPRIGGRCRVARCPVTTGVVIHGNDHTFKHLQFACCPHVGVVE